MISPVVSRPLCLLRAAQRFSVLLIGGLFAMAFLAGSARAYVLEGQQWSDGTNVVMRLGLGNAPRILIDGNTSWNVAVSPALGAWSQQIRDIRLTGVVSSAPASSGDGVNTVVFSSTVFGDSFGRNTLAVTQYIIRGSNLVEADILFNTAQTFDSYRGPLRFNSSGTSNADIQRVFLHELGHAIGLDHNNGDFIMNPTILNRYVLALDDIAGAQAMYGPPAPNNLILFDGDFDGNGSPDFLLFDPLTRETRIWYLDNNQYVGGVSGPVVAAGYAPAGTGDFNADGRADLLLYNASTRRTAIWLLRDGLFIGGEYGPTLPVGWRIVAVDDFDGNGKPDYLLSNTATRRTAIWHLNNNVFLNGVYGPTLPGGWTVSGTGDFNVDGKPDYLLSKESTRQTAIWHLNNNVFLSGVFGPTLPIGWLVGGVADFNRNGRPDLLLYRGSTRQTAIWYLNTNVVSSTAYGPTLDF